MEKLKRMGTLALALVLAFSTLSGCGGRPAGGSTSGPDGSTSGSGDSSAAVAIDLAQITDPYLAVSGLAADEVVITVGDVEVTAAEYLYWLNRIINSYLSQYSDMASAPSWDTEIVSGFTIGQSLLNQASDMAVFHGMLRHLALAEGLSPDPSIASDTNEEYANLVIQANGDESQVVHTYWANMLTLELLTKLYENNDLFEQLRELYYGENSDSYPTDAEVNAYLDENGYFRVKHILLMTIDQATNQPLEESVIAKKKATADDLLAQLRASEDPITLFDQLVNEYGEDGGMTVNADGYVFDNSDSLVGGFREATLALSVGEISDVVETAYGYHIMLRLPIDPAGYRSDYASQLLESRIDEESERLGVVRTDAFDKLDVDSFWNNMQSLQAAVQAERAG